MDSHRSRFTEPVPWNVFVWVAGIMTLILGALFAQHTVIGQDLAKEKDARIVGDAQQLQLSNDLKVQYADIQARLSAVDARLLELKTDIKNSR